MIRFFRNIREQLAADNKPAKYMRYAIGEIFLVVLGILIALQINNQNEFRKARSYELKMLSEIRKELVQDTIYFSMIRDRAQSMVDGAVGMTQYYDVPFPERDSLQKYLNKIKGFQFMYRKGAYEALKSTGLDKVSNDSLRIQITNLYDFIYPRNQLLLDKAGDEFSHWNKYLLELADLKIKVDLTGMKSFIYVPKASLLNNSSAANALDRYEYVGRSGVGRLTGVIERTKELLQSLNTELGKED